MNSEVEMDKEIIINGVDVSKGNQKYAEKYSPVEDWYKAENNTIDGINVAECVHFTRQVNFGYCELSNDSCNEFQCNCIKNKNCYYKQLKRLEQENAKQKEMIEKQWKLLEQCGVSASGELKRVSYLLENLRKENAELKAENTRLKKNIDTLENLIVASTNTIKRYRTALREIKDYLNTLSGIDNDFVNTETYLRILDCITKAEDNQ